MTCTRCNHGTAKRFGYSGKRRIQRWRCTSCKATFSESAPKLGTHYTDPETAAKALSMMLEGMSIRAISRLTSLHKNTILALLETAGERCQTMMDARMRSLPCRRIQCDEIWTFVQKKRRNVRSGDSPEVGDQWIYVAIDADTKLIPCFRVGKRVRPDTWAFLWDLYQRLANRVQLTTDGLNHYTVAVPECFGTEVDFAQLTKMFGDYGQFDTSEARYSPPRISGVISKVRTGNPDPEHISTSFVERSNLNLRMHLRRFTRLTNAYSKKLANLKAAVTLYFAWYNFCRVHQTLRVTPAMEAGLTDHAWSLAELLTDKA